MKEYEVHITEIYGLDVTVKANSPQEAKDKVEEMCCCDEISLDDLNFGDRRIEVLY